jgi:hypothetical protein
MLSYPRLPPSMQGNLATDNLGAELPCLIVFRETPNHLTLFPSHLAPHRLPKSLAKSLPDDPGATVTIRRVVARSIAQEAAKALRK